MLVAMNLSSYLADQSFFEVHLHYFRLLGVHIMEVLYCQVYKTVEPALSPCFAWCGFGLPGDSDKRGDALHLDV